MHSLFKYPMLCNVMLCCAMYLSSLILPLPSHPNYRYTEYFKWVWGLSLTAERVVSVRRACPSLTSSSLCWQKKINHLTQRCDIGNASLWFDLILFTVWTATTHFVNGHARRIMVATIIRTRAVLCDFLLKPIHSPVCRFVCCDLDGDSRLAPQEMRHFYKVQLHRVTSLVSQPHSNRSIA